MMGALALIGRNQGLNIVINLFFGPVLNAAHSIAQQINGVLTQFINNIYTATRPQITKYYAQNNEKEMWHLAINSSKWTFFLLMLISIPALLELKQVLSLWLGKGMPPYSYEISLLLILSLIIETTANQIISVFQAKNKIKKYQIFASSLLLLNIPVSYCMLKFMSTSPILPYYISAFLSLAYVASILIIAKREIGLDINYYVRNVLSRMIGVFIFSLLVSYCFTGLFELTIYRIIYTIAFSFLVSAITIWFIGFDKVERNSLKNIIYSKFKER
jgi:O-antigen/teichoic acid export membrane protein